MLPTVVPWADMNRPVGTEGKRILMPIEFLKKSPESPRSEEFSPLSVAPKKIYRLKKLMILYATKSRIS
jgi:hypothetical protein